MFSVFHKSLAAAALAALCVGGCGGSSDATPMPDPAVDSAKTTGNSHLRRRTEMGQQRAPPMAV